MLESRVTRITGAVRPGIPQSGGARRLRSGPGLRRAGARTAEDPRAPARQGSVSTIELLLHPDYVTGRLWPELPAAMLSHRHALFELVHPILDHEDGRGAGGVVGFQHQEAAVGSDVVPRVSVGVRDGDE